MTEPTEPKEEGAGYPKHKWADFLTSLPPGTVARIPDLVRMPGADGVKIAVPDLLLHCNSDTCRGERIFSAVEIPRVQVAKPSPVFLEYLCRNCQKTPRIYALLLYLGAGFSESGVATKIGEWPPFGPPTPARVISMVGPDRDLFLKGRRAENHGLGLGAFAYYRRVVENQRGRLLGEIIRVAKSMGARSETVQALEAAVRERQFSKSIELTKDAIPESLLIEGHNPLLLLHRALSVGLHNRSDAECLTRARYIRVVLTEIAERIGQVLKDTAELKEAIRDLLALPEPSDEGQ